MAYSVEPGLYAIGKPDNESPVFVSANYKLTFDVLMKHTYLKDVSTLTYDSKKCIGCGKCTEVCPHGVIGISGKKAHIVDKDSCMECGACALNCPARRKRCLSMRVLVVRRLSS